MNEAVGWELEGPPSAFSLGPHLLRLLRSRLFSRSRSRSLSRSRDPASSVSNKGYMSCSVIML